MCVTEKIYQKKRTEDSKEDQRVQASKEDPITKHPEKDHLPGELEGVLLD